MSILALHILDEIKRVWPKGKEKEKPMADQKIIHSAPQKTKTQYMVIGGYISFSADNMSVSNLYPPYSYNTSKKFNKFDSLEEARHFVKQKTNGKYYIVQFIEKFEYKTIKTTKLVLDNQLD